MAWASTGDAPERAWGWPPGTGDAPTPPDELAAVDAVAAVVPLAGATLLDLGVGRGACLREAFARGIARGIGVDSSPSALAIALEACPTMEAIESDARNVPLFDGVADVVWSHGVIEHFRPYEVRAYLAEAVRLSRRWVAVSAPNPANQMYAAFVRRHLDAETWQWGYEEPWRSYRAAFEAAGLEVVTDGVAGEEWDQMSMYAGTDQDGRLGWLQAYLRRELPGICTVIVGRKRA